MRKCSLPRPHLWVAILIAMGIPGITSAELTGDLLTDLSYYSTFEDPEKGIAAELPEENPGAWNTNTGGDPSFITVSGAHRALNLASYNAWTGDQQTVLSVEDEAFTIAFTAQTGTSANGLLFAFGPTKGGGLSFRRDETPGSLAVCTGQNNECLLSVSKDDSDVAYHHYALVQNNDGLTLYVDGEAIGGPVKPSGAVIASKFQWRSRYGDNCDGENHGSGAIDALGVWRRALTPDEIKEVAEEMAPPRFTPVPVSFDVPEGWTTKPAPTQAVQRSLTENLALEQDAVFRQTLGGRATNVAEITGDDGTAYQIFGVNDANHGNKDTPLERDVWLMVSGGNHDVIVGGSENNWTSSNHATPLRGDIAVELGKDATVNNLIGGVYKGGLINEGAVNGNILLTVKGTVNGGLVGGTLSTHNLTPVITGNTHVRVLALQSTNKNAAAGVGNRILGGSAYMGNADSGAKQTGNTAVEVILPSEAKGTFVKEIAGGSYASTASYAITGNTSVSISAPDTVTFSQPIYGGSVSNTSTATISGNTSVTLNGGTYANRVCAGGYGSNAGVEGKATLTLRGGVFTKSLEVSAENAPVGSSELIIDGGETGIDLSRATVSRDFGALTLKSNLNLGANRLPNTTFTVEGTQTLAIAVTDEEIDTRRVVLGRTESVPEGLTIAASGLSEGETWSLSVVSGLLCYAPGKQTLTWTTPGSGTAWEDGFPGFQAGDDMAFGANPAQEKVTFTNDIRVGTMTVSGNYTFAGDCTLSADQLTINKNATLMLSAGTAKGRYIRLQLLTRATSGNYCDGIALAEMKLMLAEQEVDWNGATVTATQAAENGSHKDDHLIDGNLSSKWYWTTGSTAFDNCSLTLDAGEGNTFTFDAYRLAMADQNGRNPTSWELAVSDDGVNWKTVDKRSYATSEVNAWTPNAWVETSFGVAAQATISSLDPISVVGAIGGIGRLEGSVTFEEGSTLLASPNGALTLSGPVSGTVKVVLPEDAEQWQNALDFPVLWMPKTETFTLRWTPSNTGYELMWRDGCYRLRRRFSAELSQDATTDWFAAGWKDMNNVTPTSEEWQSFTGTTDFTATAQKDITVNIPSEGYNSDRFAVMESEHTLTLSGGQLSVNEFSLAGRLVASISTLSFTSATLEPQAILTLEQTQNGTLPTISGAGTYVKTGTGTLSIVPDAEPDGVSFRIEEGTVSFWKSGSDTIAYDKAYFMEVADGAIVDIGNGASSHQVKLSNPNSVFVLEGGATLRFTNGAYAGPDYGNFAPAIRLRSTSPEKPAILAGSYGGAYLRINGTISPSEGNSKAYLRLTRSNDNPWTIPGTITGDIHVLVDTTKNLTISGNNDYTGGTDIRANLAIASANALGRGPVSIAADATLTIAANTTLNVYGALSGLGTITGPIVDEAATACALHLAEGVSLDVSEATAEACLSLNGTLTAAGAIAVTLPQDVTSTRRLLAWASVPEGVTFEAAEATPPAPTARLVAKADGLYYEFLTLAEGAQATFEGLSETAQRQLAAAAFTAGAASVAEISGTTAKRPLTTAEIDAALLCFGGVLTTTVSESAATLTVTYDFGIADMAYDREAGVLTVTAKVQGTEGAQTATFVAGSTVELLAEDEVVATVAIGETETSEIQLPVSKETTATLLETPRPLKVRVRK